MNIKGMVVEMEKILVIAPHNDDEILGVGGTMAKYIAAGNEVSVCIVANHDVPLYTKEQLETTKAEAREAHKFLDIKRTIHLDFPAVLLHEIPAYKVNDAIFETVKTVDPDIVFLPHFGDIHADHTVTAMGALVAVRPNRANSIKRVYSYETLSETEWNVPHAANTFLPNTYSDISGFLEKKLKAMSYYKSQLCVEPHARSLHAMEALAVYRGSTISVAAAEAFMLIREIM